MWETKYSVISFKEGSSLIFDGRLLLVAHRLDKFVVVVETRGLSK